MLVTKSNCHYKNEGKNLNLKKITFFFTKGDKHSLCFVFNKQQGDT